MTKLIDPAKEANKLSDKLENDDHSSSQQSAFDALDGKIKKAYQQKIEQEQRAAFQEERLEKLGVEKERSFLGLGFAIPGSLFAGGAIIGVGSFFGLSSSMVLPVFSQLMQTAGALTASAASVGIITGAVALGLLLGLALALTLNHQKTKASSARFQEAELAIKNLGSDIARLQSEKDSLSREEQEEEPEKKVLKDLNSQQEPPAAPEKVEGGKVKNLFDEHQRGREEQPRPDAGPEQNGASIP